MFQLRYSSHCYLKYLHLISLIYLLLGYPLRLNFSFIHITNNTSCSDMHQKKKDYISQSNSSVHQSIGFGHAQKYVLSIKMSSLIIASSINISISTYCQERVTHTDASIPCSRPRCFRPRSPSFLWPWHHIRSNACDCCEHWRQEHRQTLCQSMFEIGWLREVYNDQGTQFDH